jgi:hypothetical protein
MGRFYCRTEKKSSPRHIFEEKNIFKFTTKFKISSMLVTWTSFDNNVLVLRQWISKKDQGR